MHRIKTLAVAGAALVACAVTAAMTASIADAGPTPAAQPRAVPHTAPTYQPSAETHYVAIRPCRIVDTRNTTRMGSNTQRAFYVTGGTGFASQGGKSGGCGIPAGATGVTVNLLSLGASHTGYMRAWPNGQTQPFAAVLAYNKTITTSGAASLAIAATEPSLRVSNYQAKTDLTIDVTGYYEKPLAGMISDSGTPYSGSTRILGASRTATGVYEVQFDRNIRYCAATVTAYYSGYYASTSTWFDSTRPDTVQVKLWTNTGAAVNQYFYIQVDC